MRIPPIPFVVVALFFLLPCAVSAQGDPEAVYGKFHRAILAGNLDDLIKYGTPGGATDLAKLPAEKRKQFLDMLKAMTPTRYKITGRQPGNDGNSLTLRMTGSGAKGIGGIEPDPQAGVVLMVKQGGEWKVDEVSWKDAKAAAASGAGATSPAPERKPAPAAEPCIIKPVMTNEEKERCR